MSSDNSRVATLTKEPLDRVKRQWTALGEKDPFWAVLTRPGTSGGRWDRAAFFETGVQEIGRVIGTAQHFSPVRFGTAVDFGCGVGRLSQALSARFERVIGIDIAASMIDEAVRLNQFTDRCEYLHNVAADLAVVPDESVDFLYSSITLQHVIPMLAQGYIREFFRVVRPGGVVVFQLPSGPRSVTRHWVKSAMPVALTNFLWRIRTGSPEAIESYFTPEGGVAKIVDQAHGSIVHVESNEDGPPGWQSRTYFCVCDGAPQQYKGIGG
ncbi:MAG TPA: class I SAM-dependent methyltransferase [Bryobacteraceae bacterium]